MVFNLFVSTGMRCIDGVGFLLPLDRETAVMHEHERLEWISEQSLSWAVSRFSWAVALLEESTLKSICV